MKYPKPKPVLDRDAAADLWRRTLAQIPATFGRLVYLAGLRNQNTGRYEHHGLALLFGQADADRALRSAHRRVFYDWINYSLEQQKADLELYLSSLSENRNTILETWIRLAPYRSLIPGSRRGVEKRVYLTDFETLLELLKNEFGVSLPDPDA